ncbi:MAG: hypothetical protein P8N51_03545 [Pseudomonadales bacterium]|nr:hypothetical protein [Pseudomonadales bacterium]MDG1442258.1 hypothetical protein [Pseudomonadales bacterium]
MVYVIIGIVMLVILAPIIRIIPSAKQKAAMAKRQVGMKQGIRITITHIEDPDPDRNKYLSNTGKPMPRKLAVIGYSLPRPRPDNWRESGSVDWSFERRSLSVESKVPWEASEPVNSALPDSLSAFLATNLSKLPSDCVKVEEKNFILTIYWHEQGEVSELIDFLTTCVSLPLASGSMDSSIK